MEEQIKNESASNEQEHGQLHEEAVQDTNESESPQDHTTALEQEVASLKDKYIRLHADFENARKRHQRERIELFQNAGADIMKELLPVLDDLERALAHEGTENTPEGIALIYTKFKKTLEGKGLRAMEAMHQPFDTEYHEAITNIPALDDSLKGKVVDVIEKGYFINDTVLRYAKVVVGQ